MQIFQCQTFSCGCIFCFLMPFNKFISQTKLYILSIKLLINITLNLYHLTMFLGLIISPISHHSYRIILKFLTVKFHWYLMHHLQLIMIPSNTIFFFLKIYILHFKSIFGISSSYLLQAIHHCIPIYMIAYYGLYQIHSSNPHLSNILFLLLIYLIS